MLIAQNTARLISSVIIIKIVDAYSFSIESSAYVFIVVGLLFVLGSLFFLFTREASTDPKSGDIVERVSLITHLVTSVRHMKGNRNFLYFLIGDLDYAVIIAVISFYATYATLYRGVDPAVAAGLFIGYICVGAILSNFFLGTLGWFDLKHKYFVAKLFSVVALLLLIVTTADWGFFLASFFLGGTRGTRMIMYPPAVKRLSGMKDSTNYFSIAPIITLPFTAGLPLVFGKFLDHFSHLRADSYRLIFITAIGLVLISLFFIHKTDFEPPIHPTTR
jgi:Na+/melibiose symporter-like transporter